MINYILLLTKLNIKLKKLKKKCNVNIRQKLQFKTEKKKV